MGARQSTTNTNTSNSSSPRVQSSNNSQSDSSNSHTPYAGPSSNGGASQSRSNSGRHQPSSSSGVDWRQRTRSLSHVMNGSTSNGQPIGVPQGHPPFGASSPSPDSDTDDGLPFGRVFSAHSLPVQLVSYNGIKCPVCSRHVLHDDVECHLVMCLTKPRINYNEDVLTESKDECVICLDELNQGDTIARLPCLCIYHKGCIDAWFEINRCCPEHPSD